MNNEVTNNKQKKGFPKWAIVLIVVGCLYYLVPIGLFTFAMVTDTYATKFEVLEDGSVNINKGKLTIAPDVKGYYSEEKETYYIEGKIKNNTEKDYEGIAINYFVYNEAGEVLGEATTYIQKLGAGKTWNFKAIYADIDAPKVTKFEYGSGF